MGWTFPTARLRISRGAPSQELLGIRQNHETGERSLNLLKWGLIPSWSKDPKDRPKPITALQVDVP